MKDVVGLQNTNFPVCSSCSPGLIFFLPSAFARNMQDFLRILGCLRQAGRIEGRKGTAITTKIPFPVIIILLQNLPERKKNINNKTSPALLCKYDQNN